MTTPNGSSFDASCPVGTVRRSATRFYSTVTARRPSGFSTTFAANRRCWNSLASYCRYIVPRSSFSTAIASAHYALSRTLDA